MRTAITTLLLGTALALAPRAEAQPAACQGGYGIDGAVDLGAGFVAGSLSAGRRIDLNGTDRGLAVTLVGDSLDTCASVAVTQVPRDDVFALRARFEGCGERPKLRLRLKFAADCETVAARVRAGGRVVAQFAATRERFGAIDPVDDPALDPDDPALDPDVPTIDPDAPGAGTPEPPVVIVDPSPAEPDVTPIGQGPSIAAFAPIAARAGDTIALFGSNLDRTPSGERWVGVVATPPFVVVFPAGSASFGRAIATPTFVSDTEIRVTLPSIALSGTVRLAERRGFGVGPTLAETAERLVVVREEAPVTPAIPSGGQAPATQNRGTLTVQPTSLSFFNAGTFPVTGPFQIGAFLDANDNRVVDLFTTGRDDVPYLAAPVRTSEFDFTIQGGRGYFQGANAMLWVFFEGGDPNVLDETDQFFVVHLAVDLAARTARPVAMQAGVAGSPGIVMLADTFATETTIQVAQPGAGVGAIRGRIAAVPLFLESIFLPSQPGNCLPTEDVCADFGPSIETRLWSNGVVIDFDVPLFADAA